MYFFKLFQFYLYLADQIILFCFFFYIIYIMVKRAHKSSDGKYHIKGGKYDVLVGSRAQVWHGTAYKTTGDLTKSCLKMNKHGRIVSKKKSTKNMINRLRNKGYFTKKGKFGFVKKSPKKSRKSRKTKKRR